MKVFHYLLYKCIFIPTHVGILKHHTHICLSSFSQTIDYKTEIL